MMRWRQCDGDFIHYTLTHQGREAKEEDTVVCGKCSKQVVHNRTGKY